MSQPVWFTFPITTAEVRIHTIPDTSGDADKEFLALKPLITRNIADTNPDGVDSDDPVGIGAILARPFVSLGSSPVGGNWHFEGEGTVGVTLILSDPLSEDVTVNYWTEGESRGTSPLNVYFGGRLHRTASRSVKARRGF